MKAPDKLFLPVIKEADDIERLCTIWWPEDNRREWEKQIIIDAVPYIRKDLLLEWAKDNKENTGSLSTAILLQELIDKLNSL